MRNSTMFLKKYPAIGNPLDKLMIIDLRDTKTKSALFAALDHDCISEETLCKGIKTGISDTKPKIWTMKKKFYNQSRGSTDPIEKGTQVTFSYS